MGKYLLYFLDTIVPYGTVLWFIFMIIKAIVDDYIMKKVWENERRIK